jgi:hypothetical protein
MRIEHFNGGAERLAKLMSAAASSKNLLLGLIKQERHRPAQHHLARHAASVCSRLPSGGK